MGRLWPGLKRQKLVITTFCRLRRRRRPFIMCLCLVGERPRACERLLLNLFCLCVDFLR